MLRHTPLVEVNQAIVSLVIIDNSDQVKREKSAVAPSFIEVSNIVETHTPLVEVNQATVSLVVIDNSIR